MAAMAARTRSSNRSCKVGMTEENPVGVGQQSPEAGGGVFTSKQWEDEGKPTGKTQRDIRNTWKNPKEEAGDVEKGAAEISGDERRSSGRRPRRGPRRARFLADESNLNMTTRKQAEGGDREFDATQKPPTRLARNPPGETGQDDRAQYVEDSKTEPTTREQRTTEARDRLKQSQGDRAQAEAKLKSGGTEGRRSESG